MIEHKPSSYASTQECFVDIAEQSIGGANVTYGDIYRIAVAVSIKKSQLEDRGFDTLEPSFYRGLYDYMPCDQATKDGGEPTIIEARAEAASKLSSVFNDVDQLDMLLGAIQPDTPLEGLVNYVSMQTATPQKEAEFYDVITDTTSLYHAETRYGEVVIQRATSQEPLDLPAESPRTEEDEPEFDADFMKEVRKLVEEARAKASVQVAPKNEQDHKKKKNKRIATEKDRSLYLDDLRDQIDAVIDTAQTSFGIEITDAHDAIEESRIIRNIDDLPFLLRDLAIARQANLLSCREEDCLRQYTVKDLALVVAHKQSQKMPYFDITGKNTRGKRVVMNAVEELLEKKLNQAN